MSREVWASERSVRVTRWEAGKAIGLGSGIILSIMCRTTSGGRVDKLGMSGLRDMFDQSCFMRL